MVMAIQKINMQVIKKSNSKRNRRIISIIILILILAGITVLFASIKNIGPFTEPDKTTSSVNYDEPSNEQIKEGEDIKKQTTKNEGKPAISNADNNSGSGNSSSTVAVEITNEPQNVDGKLSVKTLVQEVSSTGSCTLTLNKAGQASVKKTVGVQALASASTCKFMPIDVSSLARGTWDLTIIYKSDKSNGNASQKVQL